MQSELRTLIYLLSPNNGNTIESSQTLVVTDTVLSLHSGVCMSKEGRE